MLRRRHLESLRLTQFVVARPHCFISQPNSAGSLSTEIARMEESDYGLLTLSLHKVSASFPFHGGASTEMPFNRSYPYCVFFVFRRLPSAERRSTPCLRGPERSRNKARRAPTLFVVELGMPFPFLFLAHHSLNAPLLS